MAAGIVWIASYPKSGNTWIRAFLMYLFTNVRERLPLNQISQHSTTDVSREWFDEARGGDDPWTEEETAAWRQAAQERLLRRFQTTALVKTHGAFMLWHGHRMFDMSKTAGGIYAVRNPLDIVASLAAHNGSTIDRAIEVMTETGCILPPNDAQVPQLLGSWSENVQSWTARPNPRLHVIRYEDMIERGEETFAGLAGFLGLNPPPERLRRALDLASFGSLRQAEAEAGFADRTQHQTTFFRQGRAGGWRDELTADQARRIVDAHREQMDRFGYVPEGY
jgi:hypothetical protein